MRERLPNSIYSLHPAYEMQARMVINMTEKTGRSLEEWLTLVLNSGPGDQRGSIQWLISEYGLGAATARVIVAHAFGGDTAAHYNPERLVKIMFSRGKENLRPFYNQLLKWAFSLGEDVRACPCKTMVPLYRKHVFAQLKPTTRTRLDVGLALDETPAGGRLLTTGGLDKGDRITHRIAVSHAGDMDDELHRWLKEAYRLDGH